MAQVAVRLPDPLIVEVDHVASRIRSTRSDVIRRAVELYVHRLACERDAAIYERQPLTEAELAVADDPGGWSTTPSW
ncbi:MAG: ribbon-helix-helix protein, CopG family [Candidatus Dormibacteraeota bacterium]|nr:ribbon-helix-helix protein, CopG family [Candidatus Dormibacteraeota bacterium]